MKSFFKKIAFVLALALVLTNIRPVAAANAAAAPSLKYTSKVLYVGGDVSGKYSDSCWTPSQNAEGYKVSYESNKNFIDVASNGKIKANGKGIGAAVVTVTYSKEGAKDITKQFTVKVRRNATDVKLTAASAEELANALNVGDTAELKAAKSISGKSYAKGNYGLDNYMGICSDQLTLVSDNPSVVKTDGMKVTAVGTGEANITVVATQYNQPDVESNRSISYQVVVLGGLQSAKLAATNKADLTFASPVDKDEVKLGTIVMKNANGIDISSYIKDVTHSDDLKTVTVETHISFVNNAVYTFVVGDDTAQLTAEIGDVAKVSITKPAKVIAGEATAIEYKFYDAKGVELQATDAMKERVSFEIINPETTSAYIDGKDITIWEKDCTVSIKGSYITGQLDENYEAIMISIASYTVQSVADKAATAIGFDSKAVVIGKTTGNGDDFSGKLTVPAKSNNYYLNVRVKDINDKWLYSKEISNGITFESTNPEKLFVDTLTGQLFPVAASGTVGIRVKCGDLITVYNVIIGVEEVLSSLELTNRSLILTNADVTVENTREIVLSAKTNYGNTYQLRTEDVTIPVFAEDGLSIVPANKGDNDVKLIVASKDAEAKSYSAKIEVESKAITLTVNVKDGSDKVATSFKFVPAASKVDQKITKDSKMSDYQNLITVVGYNKSGAAVYVASSAAITIKKDGKTYYSQNVTGAASVTGASTYIAGGSGQTASSEANSLLSVPGSASNRQTSVVTLSAVTGTGLTSGADYQKMEKATYVIEGYVLVTGGSCTTDGVNGKKITIPTISIIFEDTQKAPTVKFVNPQLKDEYDLKKAFEASDGWDFVSMDVAVSSKTLTIDDNMQIGAVEDGTYNIFVKSAVIDEKLENGIIARHKVAINKNITFIKTY